MCSLRFTLTGYLGGFWQQRLIIRNAIASVAVSNGSQILHFYRIITLRIESTLSIIPKNLKILVPHQFSVEFMSKKADKLQKILVLHPKIRNQR